MNIDEITAALEPLDQWAHRCHEASVQLVRSGVIGEPCRVARGGCAGVGAQHSWVVVGMDCYDRKATIIDPTLWSFRDDVEGVWVGTADTFEHRPHGAGNIFRWGRPDYPTGERVELEWKVPPSRKARQFLEILGPLDAEGWKVLAHAPVEGWPSGEIIAAIDDTYPGLVPIDIVGMVTDRNPHGLYLPTDK